MRGADTFTESLFTMHKLEDFVPAAHPLRPVRQMVNAALQKMDGLFAGMYEADVKGGRPSIAPEKLLRAMLLQVFYSVRSERQLMEQTRYNLLYRWFIGLAMDDAVWVPTVFTKNRERLIEHDEVIELFNHVRQEADQKGWLSGEHFSVDGTLIQAWAGHKSFVRKDGSDDDSQGGSFKGPLRQNSCRPDRTKNLGAAMKDRDGTIRTSIQRQSGRQDAAAGERGSGTGCARSWSWSGHIGALA